MKGKRNEPDHIWERVEKTESGCWEWTGSTHRAGYGLTRLAGRTVQVHRLAWEVANGPIPSGMSVCHHCDNPPCCRPDHLFIGTQKENLADMYRKQRDPVGERNGKHTHPESVVRGDRHPVRRNPEKFTHLWGDNHWSRRFPERRRYGTANPAARLTEAQVAEIRWLYQQGDTSHAKLARRFSCRPWTIGLIVNGVTWKGVQPSAPANVEEDAA